MKYNVFETYIEGASSPCRFGAVGLVTHKEDSILRDASKRSGIPLGTLRASWEAIVEVCGDIVEAGDGINTKLVNARPSIEGPADSINAEFKKGINRVRLGMFPGTEIDKRIGLITPHKAESSLHGPVVTGIEDVDQKLFDSYLTSDGTFKVYGNRLSIAGTAGQVGIEIVRNGQQMFLLGADDLIINKPSLLVARMPEMTDGPVQISVITAYSGGGKPLKNAHKVTWEGDLRIGTAPTPVEDAGEYATKAESADPAVGEAT
jgi:hypothetical protein